MNKGYVYILSNPSMPGLVKIGKTTRTVEGRAQELYQTGVPTPFVVEHYQFTPDCSELERTMHSALSDRRVGLGREFFAADVSFVRDMLDSIHDELVREWLDEFKPGCVPVIEPLVLGEDTVVILSDELDAHPYEISAAFGELNAAELSPALERWKEKVLRRRLDRDARIAAQKVMQ
ncbi:hypothetical protein CN97_00850 [Haematobacter massiliensis]|uniref:Bacteriophage T5 Orf172 DNA-binding domain-containing protein n=1 Tax=Haematobacter massiliensis TaxID=195105 RepID=A0A086Y0F1_9RHOB|nr:GIY-YIG nuclease family protein [Haematobacter massiliensis]KFI27751.1 hypothetical protein CN97_00850 [Haematobacter massiliensis]OWJ82731.1 hypothetical protein CDV51_17130 [Haematobacter massiliensis]